jgi:hypothetical protein
MNVVKINHRNGKKAANSFILGASIIIFLQAFLAIVFAKFITKRTDINFIIQEIGLVIFCILTFYFFFLAQKNNTIKNTYKDYSITNRFFYGMLLSALNLFPIPYYVAVSLMLASYHCFTFQKTVILLFSLGVAFASVIVFKSYIFLMDKKNIDNLFFIKNINYFIGAITLIVAILTAIKLITN